MDSTGKAALSSGDPEALAGLVEFHVRVSPLHSLCWPPLPEHGPGSLCWDGECKTPGLGEW